MKKKLLVFLMAMMVIFTLTACEKGNEGSVREGSNNSGESDGELQLYSDDTRVVYENGPSKLVFYHKGNAITAYHLYIDYGNEETATFALSSLEKDEGIDKAYTSGKYLVIEYAESEYKNFTLDEVKAAYASLNEVVK